MRQFRIKGIDYADEKLQHGLGIGSGRGRPKGSKNGQIMPGAAYMKNYKIVGQKAEGTTNLPGAQNTDRKLYGPINQNLQRDYQRAVSKQNNTQNQTKSNNSLNAGGAMMVKSNSNQRGVRVPQPGDNSNRAASTGTTNRQTSPNGSLNAGGAMMVKSNSNQRGVHVPQPGETVEDRTGTKPSENVSKGREFVNDLLRSAPDTLDTKQLKFMQPVWQNASNNNGSAGSDQPRGGAQEANQQGDGAKGASAAQGTNQQGSSGNQETNPQGDRAQGASGNSQEPSGAVNTDSDVRDNSDQQSGGGEGYSGSQESSGNTSDAAESTQPERNETPEQKSLWDGISGWFSQAGKDIGDTVVGAWNAASGAVNDAAKWAGDRLNEAGEWAKTAYNDVSNWVGGRAQEFGNWLGTATGDVGRTVSNVADAAGRWIGNTANDVADNVLGRYQVVGTDKNWNPVYGNQRQGGLLNQAVQGIRNATDAAGQWIGNTANDVGRSASNAADSIFGQYPIVRTDANGNPVYGNQRRGGFLNDTASRIGDAAAEFWEGPVVYNPRLNMRMVTEADGTQTPVYYGGYERRGGLRDNIADAANAAGAWVNQRAQDASNFVNGVEVGSPEATPYYDLQTGQWVDPVAPSLGQRISGAANDAWNGVADAANNAGGWINDNVVVPVANAANDTRNFVRNTANDAGQWVNDNVVAPVGNTVNNARQSINDWWNGTDQSFLGFRTGHTPGARENIQNAANQAGQWLNNNVASPISNAVDDVKQFAGDTASAARAIQAGVPVETVRELATARANGQLSQDEYEHRLNLAMTFAR